MPTFDTVLGRCGVRWSAPGSRAWSCRAADDPPATPVDPAVPDFVVAAIDGMTAVLAGEARDLRWSRSTSAAIDPFRRSVYAATREIRPGTTASYGEIARAIGWSPARSRRRRGAGAQPVPDHRAVPSGRRRERGADRLLGAGRSRDEAPDARARGRAGLRPAAPLRLIAGRRAGRADRRPAPGYWSAFASMASIAAATSAAPATPRGSLPFGQYSSLWTWSSGKPAAEQRLLGRQDHVRVAADVGDRVGRASGRARRGRGARIASTRPVRPVQPAFAGRSGRETVGTNVTGYVADCLPALDELAVAELVRVRDAVEEHRRPRPAVDRAAAASSRRTARCRSPTR